MKCLSLTSKSLIRKSDPVFLAKVPIMPNQYLFKNQGYNLGVLQRNTDEPLLLISDNAEFLEQYHDYYQERFEVEEKPEDFVVPSGYEVVYGQVSFDNETGQDLDDEADEEPEDGDEEDNETYEDEEQDETTKA